MTSMVISRAGAVEPLATPLQLPTIPIDPPDPSAEVYGRMIWDLGAVVDYTPYQEMTAITEAWNPSGFDRIYAIAYYFMDPQGSIVAQDYLEFTAGGTLFTVFLLNAYAIEHMVTVVTFKAPGIGYKFGLQLLELEMIEGAAAVKYETSRLEVTLGESSNGGMSEFPLTSMLGAMIVLVPMAMMAKEMQK